MTPARSNPATPTRLRAGLVIVGLWTVPLLASFLEYYSYSSNPPASWWKVLALQAVRFYSLAALTPLVFLLAKKFPLKSPRILPDLLRHLAAAGVFSTLYNLVFAGSELLHPSRPASDLDVSRFLEMFAAVWPQRLASGSLTYFLILAISFALLYHRRNQQRDLRTAALERQLADARLTALRMQLNPHFLFNTLHAVSTLMEENVPAARSMIARLSELLRLTLEQAPVQEISLRQELSVLKKYLEIEEIRFQDRLKVNFRIAPETLDALVPSLILQPLVENAIRHAIAPHSWAGLIEIGARKLNGRLELTVSDDGPGLGDAHSASAQAGIGLENCRARLRQLYGSQSGLKLRDRDSGGLMVAASLPFCSKSR